MFLLPRTGVSVDPRSGCAARHHRQRNSSDHSRHRADSYLGYRGVLPAARVAGAAGRLAILRARGVFHARTEILGGGGMKFEAQEIKEMMEVKEKSGRGAAFFDIDERCSPSLHW